MAGVLILLEHARLVTLSLAFLRPVWLSLACLRPVLLSLVVLGLVLALSGSTRTSSGSVWPVLDLSWLSLACLRPVLAQSDSLKTSSGSV